MFQPNANRDTEAAQRAGMRALWIDRRGKDNQALSEGQKRNRITSLEEVVQHV